MVDRKTFKMFEKFDKFDNELLISLVKVRPALWDRTLVRSHKDMIQRASAWREICKVMCPEYDNFTKTEKHLYTKTIIKKWTNIRDAWKKSYIQTRMKKKYTPYVYHDHLKFLEKNLQFQKKFSSQDDASGAESDPVAVPVAVPVTVPVQKTEIVYPSDSDNTSDAQYARPPSDVDSSSVGKRMTETEEEHDVDPNLRVIDVKSLIGQAQDNPHVCFTRSLLPTLIKLTDDELLEFQLGVVQLLQNIRRKRPRVTGEDFPNYGFPSSNI